MRKKVVIVGAGLGGMSAAIMLAQAGYEVEVIEKNERVGGKLNVLKKDGFSFDLGPSIFTLPQMFRPLFEGDGKKLEDYVPLRRLDPQWRNFFEDGTVIDLPDDRGRLMAEIRRVDPRAVEGFLKFLEYSKAQYDITDRGYFEKGLDTFWSFMKFYGLRGSSCLDCFRTMESGISRFVQNPYLHDILAYFIKYVGSSANDAPGFMNLMPTIQFEYGLWYVDGGLYELARGFEKRLRELGVRVRLDTEVRTLNHSGHHIVSATVSAAEGAPERIECDYLVSNMEVLPAYKKLLGENDRFMKKLARFEPSCSGIILHLGVRKAYPQLAHHNFFYSKNQKAHFNKVFHKGELPDDPTIYLVAPSQTDKTQAPEGCTNIKILPHVPHLQAGAGYSYDDCVALKERVIDKLERMGLEGLRENTIVEDFWTPFDIERKYYSNAGSIYGVVSDRRRNFAFKAPKRSTKYTNLFFAGGSVNPGGGMPMVVLSGRHVADMIRADAE